MRIDFLIVRILCKVAFCEQFMKLVDLIAAKLVFLQDLNIISQKRLEIWFKGLAYQIVWIYLNKGLIKYIENLRVSFYETGYFNLLAIIFHDFLTERINYTTLDGIFC